MKTFNKRVREYFYKYKYNSILFRNFSKVLIIMLLISAAVGFYAYNTGMNIIHKEYLYSSRTTVQKICAIADALLKEVELILGNISINIHVQNYISSPEYHEIIPDALGRVREKLVSYVGINKYISSVYVYSEARGTIINTDGETAIEDFPDRACFDGFKDMNDMSVFIRKDEVRYPYVITFIYKMRGYEPGGAIAINVDTKKFLQTLAVLSNNSTDVYMIDSERNMLFSRDSAAEIPQMAQDSAIYSLIATEKEDFLHKDGGKSMYASKQSSKYYNWDYASTMPIKHYDSVMQQLTLKFFFMNVVFVLIGMIIAFMISITAFRPVQSVIDIVENPKKWLAETRTISSKNEIEYVASELLTFLSANESLKTELESKISSLNNAQMLTLQSQINPHFLYNTLNILNWTIIDEIGIDSASYDMALNLSELFRVVLDSTEILIPVKQELAYAKMYTALLKQRYDNSFVLESHIDNEVLDCKIIKLCIQPLIENSIFHGISDNMEGGIIALTVSKNNGNIVISVKDNGIGIESGKLKDITKTINSDDFTIPGHIGLRNIRHRMDILFRDRASIEIHSVHGEGTEIILKMPCT